MKFLLASFLLPSIAAAAADTNALPALAPAYGELPPPFLEQHETTIIVGCFAFVAFVFLYLRALLRPETKVILPPEVLARAALTKLLRQPEDGKLLSEVSQILRRYVVAAFELPSGEMTTAEFCAALSISGKIKTETAGSVSSFLRECDERKFSTLPAAAPLNAVSRVLEIIALAEKNRDRQDAGSTKK